MINHEETGNKLIVKPDGALDALSSPELEKFLKDKYEKFQQIIFDLKKVDYVTSAGLRVIIQALKTMKDKEGVVLRNVCDQVMDTLKLTGYIHVLTIE